MFVPGPIKYNVSVSRVHIFKLTPFGFTGKKNEITPKSRYLVTGN